jgi:hypothetical protein
LAAFTKFLLAKKRVFDSDCSILLLLTFVDGILKEKYTPRLGSSYHEKNFSFILPKLPEGGLWEFRVSENFCSTH